MNQDNRLIFDWSAVGITAGALMEWLPAISAALSIVWLSLRIWEQIKEMRRGRRD
jgi:TctA family transporter